MPEQITPLSILYFLLHGAGIGVAVVLFLYLLMCRGKAIAPNITPPARLRRWAAALFGIMAMAHIWWILFYTYSNDTSSVIYGLLVAMDCMVLPPVFVGTLLAMLQDRRRPLWPIFVVMTPCAVIAVLQIALPSIDLTTPNKVYGLVLVVAFIIYMVVAVRQYGRWLRDNYADLEHKEVWVSLTLLIGLVLLLMCYEYTDNYVMCTIAHLIGFPLAGLLLWRVETLSDLSSDNSVSPSAQRDNCLSECSAGHAALQSTEPLCRGRGFTYRPTSPYRPTAGKALRGRAALPADRPDLVATLGSRRREPLLSQPVFRQSGHQLL